MKQIIGLSIFALMQMTSTAWTVGDISPMAIDAGYTFMDREYEPMTCADLDYPDDCFDTMENENED